MSGATVFNLYRSNGRLHLLNATPRINGKHHPIQVQAWAFKGENNSSLRQLHWNLQARPYKVMFWNPHFGWLLSQSAVMATLLGQLDPKDDSTVIL